MYYLIVMALGAVVGGMGVNLHWKWGLLKKATFKQSFTIDGERFFIRKPGDRHD